MEIRRRSDYRPKSRDHAVPLARSVWEALEALPEDALMDPTSIAEAYWMLHQQTRDAWTFELDLRPYLETW
jgi:hypothetical protein